MVTSAANPDFTELDELVESLIGTNHLRQSLGRMFKHPSPWIRASSAFLCLQQDELDEIDLVRPLLEDDEAIVRYVVSHSLEWRGGRYSWSKATAPELRGHIFKDFLSSFDLYLSSMLQVRVKKTRLKGSAFIIVGPNGVGKTTCGELAAKMANLGFFDLDEEIRNRTHWKIQPFFEEFGEASFRRVERAVLSSLLDGTKRCVIAAGGGCSSFQSSRSLIDRSALVVELKASPQQIEKRLKTAAANQTKVQAANEAAPILAKDTYANFSKLIYCYRSNINRLVADRSIDTNGKAITEVSNELAKLILTELNAASSGIN